MAGGRCLHSGCAYRAGQAVSALPVQIRTRSNAYLHPECRWAEPRQIGAPGVQFAAALERTASASHGFADGEGAPDSDGIGEGSGGLLSSSLI